MKKRILAIGDAAPLTEIHRFLRRSEFDMSRVPTAVAALSMARRIPFDLLLVVYPLADSELPELIERLRGTGRPVAESPMLVLASRSVVPQLEPVASAERVDLVALDAPLHEVARAAARHLGPIRAAPRYALAVALRIEPESRAVEARGGRSVNVSVSGVLIGARDLPPLGARLRVAFRPTASEPPVESRAEVIRHADPEREGVRGYAVAFISPEPGAIDRLESFLAGLEPRPSSPPAGP